MKMEAVRRYEKYFERTHCIRNMSRKSNNQLSIALYFTGRSIPSNPSQLVCILIHANTDETFDRNSLVNHPQPHRVTYSSSHLSRIGTSDSGSLWTQNRILNCKNYEYTAIHHCTNVCVLPGEHNELHKEKAPLDRLCCGTYDTLSRDSASARFGLGWQSWLSAVHARRSSRTNGGRLLSYSTAQLSIFDFSFSRLFSFASVFFFPLSSYRYSKPVSSTLLLAPDCLHTLMLRFG